MVMGLCDIDGADIEAMACQMNMSTEYCPSRQLLTNEEKSGFYFIPADYYCADCK